MKLMSNVYTLQIDRVRIRIQKIIFLRLKIMFSVMELYPEWCTWFNCGHYIVWVQFKYHINSSIENLLNGKNKMRNKNANKEFKWIHNQFLSAVSNRIYKKKLMETKATLESGVGHKTIPLHKYHFMQEFCLYFCIFDSPSLIIIC